MEVSRERFEELVAQALDGIPEQFTKAMRNVAVFVEDVPADPHLLGLYVGVPLTERTTSYAGVLPGPDHDLPLDALRLLRHRGAGRG